MTLDHLSGGRLVLPVGLGTLDDLAFGNVGEPTDARIRAERLDESLEILDGLWSGEPFAFTGRHYRFGPMTFRPVPVQRPRIPVWVVGAWPAERSMARAARWDGIIAQARDAAGRAAAPTPDQLREIAGWLAAARARAGRTGPTRWSPQGTTPAGDVGVPPRSRPRTRMRAPRGGSTPTGRGRRSSPCGRGSSPARRRGAVRRARLTGRAGARTRRRPGAARPHPGVVTPVDQPLVPLPDGRRGRRRLAVRVTPESREAAAAAMPAAAEAARRPAELAGRLGPDDGGRQRAVAVAACRRR